MASIHLIMVSFNTRSHTLRALDYLKRCSKIPHHITVIDNGSKDDSISYLREWEKEGKGNTLIINKKNLGFAKASNQGLELTGEGEYSCLINSDLLVSPAWDSRLIHHFQDTDRVGLVGPLGRGIGGFQDYCHFYGELPLPPYPSFPSLASFTEELYQEKKGFFSTVKFLMGCCLMLSPVLLKEVGYLDADFFGGADDLDYSIRARLKGFDLVVGHDVFVWHHVQASFSLLPKKTYEKIREDCWNHFNQKWKHIFPPNSWNLHFVKEVETEKPPFRLIKKLSR